MGKRRSKKRTVWLADTVALRMLRQVFPGQLVTDISTALAGSGDVYISRSSAVCEDFEWHVCKVEQPRDIIQYINAYSCSSFKLFLRRDYSDISYNYSFHFKVHLNFREKGRILAVLIPIYKNTKNPEDKAKLKAEINRIKYGGVLLRTNLSEVRKDEKSNS